MNAHHRNRRAFPPPHSQQPSVAESSPASESSEDAGANDVSAASSRLITGKCKLFIFCSLVIVFLCAAALAVLQWAKYDQEDQKYLWHQKTCTILSTTLAQSTQQPSAYRVEANVTNIEDAPADAPSTIIAYYGQTADYPFTRKIAEEHLSRVKVGATFCWVQQSNASSVSVKRITEKEVGDVPPGMLYTAWAATFAAGAAAAVAATLGTHWLNASRSQRVVSRMHGHVRGGALPAPPPDAAKRRAHLSSEQARRLCEVRGRDVAADDPGVADWTCAVCLEDDDGMAMLHTVVLPCEHRFHRGCIRKWLRRGKAACPLCNWDARSMFDESGQAVSDVLPVDGNSVPN